MLQNITELYGLKLAAKDGAIGHVKDFYFDDKSWVIRYLVADSGSWLSGRLVLLSPHAFGHINHEAKLLNVNLTQEQIEKSPSIELHKPVSRQYEIDYYQYYGWPAYWTGGDMWGLGGFPVILPPSKDELAASAQPHHRDDKHLRSTHAVTGYHIQTTDGPIGHVKDFLVDDKSWAIRQIEVEAGHWYAGKAILIPAAKVERISYEDSTVFVNVTKADIERTEEHKTVHAAAAGHRGPEDFPTD